MFGRLVALDLTLGWRSLTAPLGGHAPLALAAALIGLHAAAWPVGLYLSTRENGLATIVGAGALFVLPWAAASPMAALARLLAQCGDLDLLLAAPVKPRAILAARLVALGLEAVGPSALLLAPLADVCALQGRPHWLALYPALLGAALLGASLGAALALALALWLGPRRARVATQVGAALLGGGSALAAQGIAFLPAGAREQLAGALGGAPAAALNLPVRAALGDPRALALWLALGLAALALAATTLARPFASAALSAAGAAAAAPRRRAPTRFTASLSAALRRKERRLLWRDPWLLSQMALQALYMLPIALILWRNGGVTGNAGVAFAPTLVVIAGQLSASLAWIALSGEDAPDFIATAPATRAAIERAKLGAIAGPVALTMAAPLLGLAFVAPRAAAAALVCGVGACASGAALMLWRQAPARRGQVLRRHAQSRWLALVEHWLSLCWAGVTGMAALGSVAAAALGLVALTLWLARPRGGR